MGKVIVRETRFGTQVVFESGKGRNRRVLASKTLVNPTRSELESEILDGLTRARAKQRPATVVAGV